MRPTRFYSNRQEKAVASAVGGRKVANSGATVFFKGDVDGGDFLIECKTSCSEKQSFSVKRAWLEKNEEERYEMGKSYSALAFDFGDNGKRYYVIDEKLFVKLMELLKKGKSLRLLLLELLLD